jgi:short-subunit dehydrogenase
MSEAADAPGVLFFARECAHIAWNRSVEEGHMSMNGKVVWITGASSGIGEALAYEYSKTGARIILSSRNEEKLVQIVQQCANPKQHMVLPLDLTDTGSLGAKVETALGLAGRIDVLMNNGGVSQRSLAAETTLEVDRRIMETNFFGTVALTKAVLPSMIERRSGSIAVVTSIMGKFSTPQRSAYNASKHALHGFFDALRAEVWRQGISVTLICPGAIKTNISINALNACGDCHGVMDDAQARGMLPDECARRIIRAVDLKKDEVYIGGPEVLAVYLKRFAPGLLNRIMRKAKVT